ncbi:hypothetical protein [Deinococcus soli (ex Cha et al. 2016)]|nr:hypothetical protein [Deinococcus soli (ex Cha et al. 2016)]
MTRASAATNLERLSINASAVRLPTATSHAPGTSTASTPGVTRGVFGAA